MNPQRRTYYGARWYIAWQFKRDVQRMAGQGYRSLRSSFSQYHT